MLDSTGLIATVTCRTESGIAWTYIYCDESDTDKELIDRAQSKIRFKTIYANASDWKVAERNKDKLDFRRTGRVLLIPF